MSNLRNGPFHVTNIIPMSIGSMSHVDFKKKSCHPVDFKGKGPHRRKGFELIDPAVLLKEKGRYADGLSL